MSSKKGIGTGSKRVAEVG